MPRWLYRRIALAAPHCTLWFQCWDENIYRFRFWPKWCITEEEIEDMS